MNKFIKVAISLLIFTFLMSLNCYAGMADLTDDKAQIIKNEEVKNQQQIDKQSIGKSSNNFLKSLSIKGYTLTPEFNKQVINYHIEGEINDSQIEIIAEADDSRAKVIGSGVINLEPGENQIKVDCEAENGDMKSYFITINRAGEKIQDTTNETDTNELSDTYENNLNEEIEKINEFSNNKSSLMNRIFTKKKMIILIIVVILIVLIILTLIIRKNKKSARHSK